MRLRRVLASWGHPGAHRTLCRVATLPPGGSVRVMAAPSAQDSRGKVTNDMSSLCAMALNIPDISTELPGEKPCQAFPQTVLSVSFPISPCLPFCWSNRLSLNQRKTDLRNTRALLSPIKMAKIFQKKIVLASVPWDRNALILLVGVWWVNRYPKPSQCPYPFFPGNSTPWNLPWGNNTQMPI